jgi:MFS family permease
LILSAAADVTGGLTSDAVTRRFGLRAGRCGVGGVSLAVAGVSLIAGVFATNTLAAALLLALSGASASFLLAACWGVCQDIGGTHAGLVSACMNTSGQVGAVLSPIILALFLEYGSDNWTTPICIAGGLYLAGSLCWLFVDPLKPIAVGDGWEEIR